MSEFCPSPLFLEVQLRGGLEPSLALAVSLPFVFAFGLLAWLAVWVDGVGCMHLQP